MSTRILYVRIKSSMFDPISDVISIFSFLIFNYYFIIHNDFTRIAASKQH